MSIFSMLLAIRSLNGCKRMKYASADMMQKKKRHKKNKQDRNHVHAIHTNNNKITKNLNK